MKLPLIIGTCGSHTNVYVPATNVTVHVIWPTKDTDVDWFTPPGPERWKLWSTDWSLTAIV